MPAENYRKIFNHHVCILVCIELYLGTHWLQNSSNPVLVSFCREKNVSALNTCSGLVTVARTCMSHDVAPQEKVLHCSVLLGSGTD